MRKILLLITIIISLFVPLFGTGLAEPDIPNMNLVTGTLIIETESLPSANQPYKHIRARGHKPDYG